MRVIQKYSISILDYDPQEKRFAKDLRVQRKNIVFDDCNNHTDDKKRVVTNLIPNDDDETTQLPSDIIQPSKTWLSNYYKWKFHHVNDNNNDHLINDQDCVDCENRKMGRNGSNVDDSSKDENYDDQYTDEQKSSSSGIPLYYFDTIEDLNEFNSKGFELAKQLEEELLHTASCSVSICSSSSSSNDDLVNVHAAADADNHTALPSSAAVQICVEPYKPLYTNLIVGCAVSNWWHVKDMNYGFIIPVQKLPISDPLKSQLQEWRFRKGMNWIDPNVRRQIEMEGHSLETHILSELKNEISKISSSITETSSNATTTTTATTKKYPSLSTTASAAIVPSASDAISVSDVDEEDYLYSDDEDNDSGFYF